MNYTPHPSIEVQDSTKQNEYMTCPRLNFLEHVLGWRKVGAGFHLDYGSAFHEGLAMLYNCLKEDGCYTPGGVLQAQAAFDTAYKAAFGGEAVMGVYNDPNCATAKNLTNGMLAIEEYAKRYSSDRLFSVEHVETVGTIPIDVDRRLFFRLDTVLQRKSGRYMIMEHKTASQDNSSAQAHWPLAFQIGTYNHVLYMMYGDAAEGVEADIIILRKKGNEFRRVPCWIQPDRMQDWLERANHYMSLFLQDLDIFVKWANTDGCVEETTMPCFHKRTTSCLNYGECSFMNFCLSYHNPLKATRSVEPPAGYVKQFWDPREMESKEGTKVVTL